MKHFDLFAGIGGFSLAASWMGWETVAQVEWDKWCQKVLAKNFPNALRFGDIVEFNKMLQNGKIITDTDSSGHIHGKSEKQSAERKINALCELNNSDTHGRINLGRIDLITGGFPCQPFSHAGKRKGTSDNRWLWPEMLTTIRILKPPFVVGENVAGLVSMENGKTLDGILADLENEGYTVESFIIPACAVGAWHRRDRIWIVAHNQGGNESWKCNQQSEEGKHRRLGGINVTDTEYKRLEGFNGDSSSEYREDKGIQFRSENSRAKFEGITSYSGISGLQGMQKTGNNGSNGEESFDKLTQGCNRGGEMRDTQSDLGMLVDGLPSGLAGWDREPEGVPRVATGVKDRVNKLKGLRNAIVPQVVYEIFKAIDAQSKNNS